MTVDDVAAPPTEYGEAQTSDPPLWVRVLDADGRPVYPARIDVVWAGLAPGDRVFVDVDLGDGHPYSLAVTHEIASKGARKLAARFGGAVVTAQPEPRVAVRLPAPEGTLVAVAPEGTVRSWSVRAEVAVVPDGFLFPAGTTLYFVGPAGTSSATSWAVGKKGALAPVWTPTAGRVLDVVDQNGAARGEARIDVSLSLPGSSATVDYPLFTDAHGRVVVPAQPPEGVRIEDAVQVVLPLPELDVAKAPSGTALLARFESAWVATTPDSRGRALGAARRDRTGGHLAVRVGDDTHLWLATGGQWTVLGPHRASQPR